MADFDWGKRDTRGEWQPEKLPEPGPLFQIPWRPLVVLKHLFGPQGVLMPYNLLYALLAVIAWLFFTPGLDRTAHFQIGWIAEIYARNAVLLTLVAGGLHLRLYTARGRGPSSSTPTSGLRRVTAPSCSGIRPSTTYSGT